MESNGSGSSHANMPYATSNSYTNDRMDGGSFDTTRDFDELGNSFSGKPGPRPPPKPIVVRCIMAIEPQPDRHLEARLAKPNNFTKGPYNVVTHAPRAANETIKRAEANNERVPAFAREQETVPQLQSWQRFQHAELMQHAVDHYHGSGHRNTIHLGYIEPYKEPSEYAADDVGGWGDDDWLVQEVIESDNDVKQPDTATKEQQEHPGTDTVTATKEQQEQPGTDTGTGTDSALASAVGPERTADDGHATTEQLSQGVTVRLRLPTTSAFATRLSLAIVLRNLKDGFYVNENKEHAYVEMRASDLRQDITIKSIPSAAQLDSNIFPAPIKSEIAKLFTSPTAMVYHLELHIYGSVPNHGFSTFHNPNGQHHDLKANVAANLSGDCIVHLVFNGDDLNDIDDIIKDVNNRLDEDRNYGPDQDLWFGKVSETGIPKRRKTLHDQPQVLPMGYYSPRPELLPTLQDIVLHSNMGAVIDYIQQTQRRQNTLSTSTTPVLDIGMKYDKIVKCFLVVKLDNESIDTLPPLAVNDPVTVTLTNFLDTAGVVEPKDVWHGRVIKTWSHLPLGSIIIRIQAPVVDAGDGKKILQPLPEVFARQCKKYTEIQDRAAWHSYTPEPLQVNIKGTGDANEQKARNKIVKGSSLFVELVRHEEIYSLDSGSPSADFVGGIRYDMLKLIDVHHGLRPRSVQGAKEGLDDDQVGFFDGLKRTPGGKAFCLGPPGSGKTRLVRAIIEPFIHLILDPKSDEPKFGKNLAEPPKRYTKGREHDGYQHIPFRYHGENHAKGYRDSCLVHYTSNLNLNCNEAAKTFFKSFVKIKKDVLIVRVFAKHTEDAFVRADTFKHDPSRLRPEIDEEIFAADMEDCVGLAQMVEASVDMSYGEYMNRSILDKRMTTDCVQFSMGLLMCVVLDIIPKGFRGHTEIRRLLRHPIAQHHARFQEARNILKTFTDYKGEARENLDEEKAKLTAHLNTVAAFILRHADVIISTPAMLTEPRIYNYSRPHLIVFDEVARASMLELVSIMGAFPSCIRLVCVGDVHQIQPNSEIRPNVNPFALSMKISPALHAMHTQFPVSILKTSYRSTAAIGNLLKTCFYHDVLEPNPLLPSAASHTFHAAARRAFSIPEEIQDKDMVLVEINNPVVETMRYNASKLNQRASTVCVNLLFKLLDNGLDTDSVSIAILSPYSAQKELYERWQTELSDRYGPEVAARITIDTFDGAQGAEFDIVFLDMVIKDQPGFLKKKQRLTAAVSRARYGLILIVSDTLKATKKGLGDLGKCINHLRKKDVAFNYEPVQADYR